MIHIIDASEVGRAPRIVDEMHRLRARVFQDRLGWEVQVFNGRERDYFDDLTPVYLVHLDDDGALIATLRLLPTTGPHMLSDTFPELNADGEPIRSPTIWESSRFCVDTARIQRRPTGKSIADVTGELLCGAYAFGLQTGLTHFTSAFDAMMHRILRRAGAHHDLIGERRRIGEVMAMAGLFEISSETMHGIRERCGVAGQILAPREALEEADRQLVES